MNPVLLPTLLVVLAVTVTVALCLRSRRLRPAPAREPRLPTTANPLLDRYGHLFRHSNDVILLLDEQMRVVDANDRAVESYGWSLAELRGKGPEELRGPDIAPGWEADLRHIVDEDGAIFETRHRRRDGTVFDVEVSSRMVQEGGQRFVQAIVRDVSERRRHERELAETQRALAESRAHLEGIITSARDAIVSVDGEARITLCNAAAAAIMNGSPTELMGRSLFELLPPAMHAIVRPRLGLDGASGNESMTTGSGSGGVAELYYHLPDEAGRPGEERAIEASFSPLESGGRRSCTIIFRDLSDRRRADERQRILARLVEQSSNLFMVTDTNGNISYVNPRFEAVTGYTLDEVRGTNPRFLKSGHTPDANYAELWATVMAGREWHGELVNHTKAGKEYLARVTIAPVADDTGAVTHLVGIEEDITEQHRLAEEFHQAQKLETLGMVAGGVAHDFNNMLSAILGYAELAAEALPPGSTVREDVDEVRTICGRAAGLTRQLLAFSRRQPIAPDNIDLNGLLLNLFKMLRRLVGEDIELVVLPSEEAAWVRADAGQIEQVVMNLAVNARDAMPLGGKLRIEARHVLLGPGQRRAPSGLADGRYVALHVTDTGTGMTPETMSHLFEPFFTTKEKGRGTGLGLATCFGIVKQSGGHIGADSEPGAGTCFEVLLPSVEAQEDSFEAAQRRPVVDEEHDERVLLVEDDPQVRNMLRRALSRAGYRVTEAGHGEEALRIVAAEGPGSFALVLTDLVMPRLGGVELVEQLHLLDPEMKVLFISGYADDMALRGRVLEATNFLPKPFTPSAILERVRGVLRGELRAAS